MSPPHSRKGSRKSNTYDPEEHATEQAPRQQQGATQSSGTGPRERSQQNQPGPGPVRSPLVTRAQIEPASSSHSASSTPAHLSIAALGGSPFDSPSRPQQPPYRAVDPRQPFPSEGQRSRPPLGSEYTGRMDANSGLTTRPVAQTYAEGHLFQSPEGYRNPTQGQPQNGAVSNASLGQGAPPAGERITGASNNLQAAIKINDDEHRHLAQDEQMVRGGMDPFGPPLTTRHPIRQPRRQTPPFGGRPAGDAFGPVVRDVPRQRNPLPPVGSGRGRGGRGGAAGAVGSANVGSGASGNFYARQTASGARPSLDDMFEMPHRTAGEIQGSEQRDWHGRVIASSPPRQSASRGHSRHNSRQEFPVNPNAAASRPPVPQGSVLGSNDDPEEVSEASVDFGDNDDSK